jgi:hypothetical protein
VAVLCDRLRIAPRPQAGTAFPPKRNFIVTPLIRNIQVGSFRLVIQAFLLTPAVSDGLKAVGGDR